MEPQEMRWRIVRRLWNDDIVESAMADVDTVVDFAVPSSDEADARELIQDEMASDANCPLVWGIAGQAVTLERDKDLVAAYIYEHGGQDAVPWDLRDRIPD